MKTTSTKPLSSQTVKQYGTESGAAVVGIAASKDFKKAPKGFSPADIMTECRSVIVLGAPFPKEVLRSITEYTAMRNEMVSKMTEIAKKVEKLIKKSGYKAKAISAIGGKYIDGNHHGFISLKHAAELAGLGIIGKNYLLTNEQYGNLLWLSAVLTDAELKPDQKAKYKICDNCGKCVEACPSGALKNYSPNAKSAQFGKKACSQFYKIVNKKLEIQCFACRTVCPYGKTK